MKKKTVSLIVLNYNGKKHLKDCFTSIFNQIYMPDEIILFDNDSTDRSIGYIEKYFPKVKIVSERGYNTGTAKGSNIAFSQSYGDYVIFMSNDIKLDKNCVKELIIAIKKDKKIGICTSVHVHYKKDKKSKQYLIDNAGGSLDIFGFAMQNYPEEKMEDIPIQKQVFFSYGSSFIIPRKLFKKVGKFDEKYFNLNEDIDLSWRVRLLGYKIIYSKKSFVYHKGSATLGALYKRSIKRYWSEKNNIRSVLKNCDLTHLLWMFPIYLLLLFGEMFYFLYRFKFSLFFADLKAILWNVINFPSTLYERKKIQSIKRKNNINSLFVKTSFKLKLFRNFSKSL